MKTTIAFLVFLLASVAAWAQFSARVVRIIDGDSIVVIDSNLTEHNTRLTDIDCPEKGQPFGGKAKDFTARFCNHKMVRIIPNGTDKYGRTLATVLADGQSLNEALLINGLAWHFIKYSSSAKLAALEQQARSSKTGLWKDPKAIAPWNWRHLPKP